MNNPKMSLGALKRAVELAFRGSLWEFSSSELKEKILGMGLDPSGKSVAQMEQMLAMALWAKNHPNEPFPDQFDPMLAHDATKKSREWLQSLKDTDWWIQIKANGMRSLLQMGSGFLKMTSRDISVTDFLRSEHQNNVLGFKSFRDPFEGKTVVDGELVSPSSRVDTGTTVTSSMLQAVVALVHMETERSLALQRNIGTLKYKAFDITWFEGKDVTRAPYEERVAYLETAFAMIKKANSNLPFELIETIKTFTDPYELFKQMVAAGEEGIMLKRRDGKYGWGKRSQDTLKVKRFLTVDGWVSGSVPASEDKKNKDLIGGFMVSAYVDGREKVIASVSGLTDEVRRDATVVSGGKPALHPKYLNRVVELEGQEWAPKSGLLIHARISEWRPEKPKSQCQLRSEDMGLD